MERTKLNVIAARILRPLRLPEVMVGLIAIGVLLGIVVVIIVWNLNPPSDRQGFVEEATLAATVLGFLVASIALLGTVEQMRSAQAPPILSVKWCERDKSDSEYLQFTTTHGTYAEIPPLVRAIELNSEVLFLHDSTASIESRAFKAEPEARKLSVFFQLESKVWDIAWLVNENDVTIWDTNASINLEEKERIYLPEIALKVEDLARAKMLLDKHRVMWVTHLVFHTNRGNIAISVKKDLLNATAE